MFAAIPSTKGTWGNVQKWGLILGVIKVANYKKLGAPSFAQPKPKSNRVRFLSEFSNLNEQLKRKSYPMPKINELLLKLEGFQYATSLNLNMGYYHICPSKKTSNLCTTILPWRKYFYKRILIGVANSPDIFQ